MAVMMMQRLNNQMGFKLMEVNVHFHVRGLLCMFNTGAAQVIHIQCVVTSCRSMQVHGNHIFLCCAVNKYVVCRWW